MKKAILLLPLLVLSILSATAQINFSANDFGKVPVYNGNFQYGTNMGYYGNTWDDKSLADISAGNPSKNVKGIGSKTFHLPLPEHFLEFWGYNVRVDMFNHYATLGVKDNTVFLEEPSAAHRDNTNYGCSQSSRLFKNMYEPIWDGGANGTPVNDNNYLALYIYKTVSIYKSYVKYWEIINEPDLEYGTLGDGDAGTPGNWFENDPPPCSLPNLYAPIFHYIRAMRIAYEVVKYVDPTAYVSPGGLGKPGFLDAILRYTDNPAGGAVSAAYPLKGGAYFDALSFHMYPIYHLHQWDNSIFGFAFKRHSDEAIVKYVEHKNKFLNVLNARGYNNTTYPAKHIITTENNIPNQAVNGSLGPWIGSQEAQRNYVIKAAIESQREKIDQLYLFVLGNDKDFGDPTASELSYLGLYQNLVGKGPLLNGGVYNQQTNESGVALKTTSDLLLGKRLDVTVTAAMNFPANVKGAAFKDDAGSYVYVLWAKTSIDQSEAASATYSFPAGMVSASLTKKLWDFSNTGATSTISSSNIALNGTPVFLTSSSAPPPPPPPPPPTVSCDSIRATAGSGSISISGINAPVASIQVFNSAWASVYNQTFTNSPGTVTIPSLATGVYHVTVNFNTAAWAPICSKSVDVTVGSSTPPPPPTTNCSSITIAPATGGITLGGIAAPIASIQVFNSSWASIYNQTFSNSPGTVNINSLAAGTYHVKVNFYTAAWSLICEKSQDVTVSSSTPPGGGTPDCNNITVTPGAGALSLGGLTAPVVAVQVFNSSWATVHNQTYTNTPGTINIPSLVAGVYHVKITFYTSSWSFICEKVADATVGSPTVAAQMEKGIVAEAIEREAVRTFSVAPNPFAGTIQVSIGHDKNESATLVVIDVSGREIFKQAVTLQKGYNKFTLDGTRFTPGSFFLKLITKERVESLKMVKQ